MLDRLKRTLHSESDLTWLQAEEFIPEGAPEFPPDSVRMPRRRRFDVNPPLVLGGLVVLALFLVVLFGPVIAPANPYLQGQRSTMVLNGELLTPPFPPMPEMPLGSDQWGRDILSMLLYGTRNTLVACLFIAMARILLGSTLGMLAGWNEGGIIDRAVMGLIEATTALPSLLTGMILILALGIERGITVFILALCLVGWAEIAQYLRSEFMVVRRKPFIEGARVVGLSGLGIAIRHILPNIMPALVIIAVLEMGAALMVLGELGFIGIFIGGGGWVQVGDTTLVNIADIPEWGAMMAGARMFARSRTWMVFYPAMAFFLAVLGFNLLGEGLRRIVQRRGVSTAFILSRRMFAVVAAITLATAYIVTHVGPAPSYASLAQSFDATNAMQHLAVLASPELSGRAPGSQGADDATAYIAARFQEYGLETLKHGLDYQLPWTSRIVEPLSQPLLVSYDAEGREMRRFQYFAEFGPDINGHGGAGEVRAPVVFLTFDRPAAGATELIGLDFRQHIVMYMEDDAPSGAQLEILLHGAQALIVVDEDITPRLQLSQEGADYLRPRTVPILRLHPAAADALLEPEGLSLAEIALVDDGADPVASPWRSRELQQELHIRLELSDVNEVETDNVIGVWRGADAVLNDQLVVIATHYDGPGKQPDGSILHSANDGPSGAAIMLEMIRLWTTSGFQPRRTIFFVAWSGGLWQHSGAHEYLAAQAPFSILETVAVVNLGGLGRGGDRISLSGDANLRSLFERTAAATGLAAMQGGASFQPYQNALNAPWVTVGWESSSLSPGQDTLESLQMDKLAAAGQTINLAVITLGREYDY